jgi:hypothetical protein
LTFLRIFYLNLFPSSFVSSPVAKKIVALPKSANKERIASNFKDAVAVSKALDTSDIEELDGIAASGKQTRRVSSFLARQLLKVSLFEQLHYASLAYVFLLPVSYPLFIF